MNAQGVPPADSKAGRPDEPRGDAAARRPVPPGRRAAFEQSLRHEQEAAEARLAADGEPAMDGAPLCLGAASGAAGLEAGGHDPLVSPPQPLFGATLGLAGLPRGRRGASGLSLGLAVAPGRGSRLQSPASHAAPAPADEMTPEAREAAWELVRELTSCLHVSERTQAQSSAVHLELKGRLLAGTQVSFVRRGCRLEVEIAPRGEQVGRVLREQADSLRELLVRAAPDCEVSLRLAEAS